MFHKKFALLSATALLASAVACSNAPETPSSPGSLTGGEGNAAPDGSTLKVTAPAPQSPVNGAQPQTLTFVAGASTPQFAGAAAPALSYELEVKNGGGTTVCSSTGNASGSTVTINPTCFIEFDVNHTWRMRARLGNATGPWSAAATFRSPAGSFITRNEAFDLLIDGRTIGEAHGGVQFTDRGAFFPTGAAYIAYTIPDSMEEGSFSFIADGVDEGNPGDKSKVMSTGEGHDDVTDNDYRQTLEVRGSMYPQPGTVTYRIITGDAGEEHRIHDTNRHLHMVSWSRSQTYFFKMYWGPGYGGYEIRLNGPNGPIHDEDRVTTDGHAYRPTPLVAYIGAPPSRGGVVNQTHPGMTVRSVWLSARERPSLPTIIERP